MGNLSSRGLRKSFIIGLLVWHVIVLEVVSVLAARERGAGFVDAFEFAVAHDLGIGVVDLQGAEQGDEGSALGRRAGVGGAAFLVEASFVADADGVGIVVAGVHADLVFVAGLEDLTVFFDEVVVADAFAVEAGVVAGFEHFNSETLVAAVCRTVNDNEIDFAGHKILF